MRYDIPTVSQDITLRQGSLFAITFTFTDGTDPLDLTGWSMAAEVRKTFTEATPQLTMTFDGTDAATGVMVLYALATDIDAMDDGTYDNASDRLDAAYGFWEAELIDDDLTPNRYRVAEGVVSMSRQVSTDD